MNDIDFVVTWVDGSDQAWLAEKQRWMDINTEEANISGRYRDWGFLPYWFRAVEKYAPWVRMVHFVTWGHLPPWLNTSCPKLAVVRHEEFIPSSYLPTFSSRAIELNLHRIQGLSENFVYFNDDVFLNAPAEKEFFFKNGLPCDFIQMNHIVFDRYNDKFNHTLANDEAVINEHFTRKDLLAHWRSVISPAYPLEDSFRNMMFLRHKYILNMKSAHLALSFRKREFDDVWQAVPDILEATCRNKFRAMSDVNPWLIRNWRLMKGAFTPVNRRKMGRAYFLRTLEDTGPIQEAMRSAKTMICINDGYMPEDEFSLCKKRILEEFQKKLPEKSSFER